MSIVNNRPMQATATPPANWPNFGIWFPSTAADRAFVDALAAARRQAPPDRAADISIRRARLETSMALGDLPAGVSYEAAVLAGHGGEWTRGGDTSSSPVILYLHGGALIAGSPSSHRAIAARLALCTGLALFSLDYPLAPEQPFPVALDAIIAVARSLHDSGYDVILAGDSAGGGLAVAAALGCAQEALPIKGLILLSPWLDLTCTLPAYVELADCDPILNRDSLLDCARAYLRDASALAPAAFPLTGDLSTLPPALVHVGEREVLRDDAILFAGLMHQRGRSVTLQGWQGMCHVWHAGPDSLVSVQRAFVEIGLWTRSLAKKHGGKLGCQ